MSACRRIPASVPAVCLLVFATAGCLLPPTSYDVELGHELAQATEQEIGRYDEQNIEGYVAAVGQRLCDRLDATPFRYRFRVLDQSEPNAFAAPGGFVYVSRGLVVLAASEDELAGVLAHEIAHVEERHTVAQMSGSVLPGILSIPGNLIGGIVSRDLGNLVNAPIRGIGALTRASYSRHQETESDRLGQELAARAGYEPAALAPMLARIERVTELETGDERRPSFFDTHPPTPDRTRDIRTHAAELRARPQLPAPRPDTALDDEAFLLRLEGLLHGNDPADGEFRENLYLHPDLDVAVEFPRGWRRVDTRTLAGAVAPDDDALIVYGLHGEWSQDGTGTAAEPSAASGDTARDSPTPRTIDEIADERRDELEGRGLALVRDEAVQVAGHAGRLLVFREGRARDATRIFQVWLAIDDRIHQFLGLGREPHRELFGATVRSLRPLTDAERSSFTVQRVVVTTARGGETFAELAHREDADARLELTAIWNDLAPDAELTAGRLVKLLRERHYRPAGESPAPGR